MPWFVLCWWRRGRGYVVCVSGIARRCSATRPDVDVGAWSTTAGPPARPARQNLSVHVNGGVATPGGVFSPCVRLALSKHGHREHAYAYTPSPKRYMLFSAAGLPSLMSHLSSLAPHRTRSAHLSLSRVRGDVLDQNRRGTPRLFLVLIKQVRFIRRHLRFVWVRNTARVLFP